MFITNFPLNVRLKIISYLTYQDIAQLNLLSQHTQQSNQLFRWKKKVISSFSCFKQTIFHFKYFVLLENYPVGLLNKAAKLLDLPEEKRMHHFFNEKKINEYKKKYPNHLKKLLSDGGVISLKAQFITPREAFNVTHVHFLHGLLSPLGLVALKEKLITPKQTRLLRSSYTLVLLLTTNGLHLLKDKLLNFDELSKMPSCYLEILIQKHEGYEALQKKLITMTDLYSIPHSSYLASLLSPIGLTLLEEKWFTMETFKLINSQRKIDYVTSKEGLAALRDHQLTPQEIIHLSKDNFLKIIEMPEKNKAGLFH